MTELVTGQFYWVQPASDPDEDNKPSPASSPLCRQVCVRRGHLDLPWPGRAVGVADALGGRRPAEPLLPHLTSAKLAGRHFEAGQKLDIALIASSGALADAGVPV